MIEFKVSFIPNNKKDGEADLQMRVRWGSNILVSNLGYRITIDKWDTDLQLCRNNTTHGKKKIAASEINKRIRRYRSAMSEVADNLSRAREAPTKEELRGLLDSALGLAPEGSSDVRFSHAFLDYVQRCSKLHGWAPGTTEQMMILHTAVVAWRKDVLLRDFNSRGLEDFFIYLESVKKLRAESLSGYIRRLKTFLRWADRKGGYNLPKDYLDFSPRIKKIKKTIVWLTWEEIGKLRSVPLEGDRAVARDLLLFSCFTGLRHSDIVALRHSSVRDDKIHLDIKKTTAPVTIELNRHSRLILLRYKDADPDRCFPFYSAQSCDHMLKKVCRQAGIDAPTLVSFYKGGERVDETEPKFKYISMHTGRRTFICLALEKGISPDIVMRWTGHRGYEEMRPYIDISDKAKETAMKLFDF